MKSIIVELPIPPSANTSKRPGGKGRAFVSTDKLKDYKAECAIILRGVPSLDFGRYGCKIVFYFNNKCHRDIANFEKHPVDACVKAGIIPDDSYIDDMRLVRGAVAKKKPNVELMFWVL